MSNQAIDPGDTYHEASDFMGIYCYCHIARIGDPARRSVITLKLASGCLLLVASADKRPTPQSIGSGLEGSVSRTSLAYSRKLPLELTTPSAPAGAGLT